MNDPFGGATGDGLATAFRGRYLRKLPASLIGGTIRFPPSTLGLRLLRGVSTIVTPEGPSTQ